MTFSICIILFHNFAEISSNLNNMDWNETLTQKIMAMSEAEFDYIETKDINKANNIDYGVSGVYMECTLIYFKYRNLTYILKENGRRKMAQAYTMYKEIVTALVEREGGFVNCYSPEALLIVFPGKEETLKPAVRTALEIVHALSETYKNQFNEIKGIEFSMGLDHGHIMGTKNTSDIGFNHLSWFGLCIHKAMRISEECARPFYVGISGNIYHSLPEDFRVVQRRILGLKKNVELWTKVTYQYDNVKKHLYQTNHKINPFEEK